jgi:hypothetical protein
MLHSTLARIALSRTPTHSWRWASVARPPGDVNGTPTHAPYSVKLGATREHKAALMSDRSVLENTSVKDRSDDTGA